MLRLAALLLALGVYTGALAGSQGPAPSTAKSESSPPQTQTAQEQQPACDDKRGSDKCPFVIEVLRPSDAQSEATKAEDRQQSESTPDRWMTWLTAALCILAAIQAFLFYWNTRTVRRQLRAYVFAETGAIGNIANPLPPAPGEPAPLQTDARLAYPTQGPVSRLVIRVSGQTPAYNVIHWGAICVREYPLVGELPGRDLGLRPMPSNLGPGALSTKNFVHRAPLAPDQIDGIRNGTMAIYVYGEITYMDAFGAHHWSKYRLMHCAFTSGVIGVSTELSYCEEGNEADQPVFKWL